MGIDDTFPFGKYKEETVKTVLRVNPSYIVWWDTTISAYPIPKDLVEEAEERMEQMKREARSKRASRPARRGRVYYSDDDSDHDLNHWYGFDNDFGW
jgi:hypothetical protein